MKLKLLYLLLFFISNIAFAQWQMEGTARFTNDATDVAIASDTNDVPYIAYADNTDGQVHVKKFDGTNWIDVGSNATGVVIPSLMAIAINPVTDQPWVVYRNNSTSRLDVIRFDGTNWVTERTSLTNFNPHSKTILKFSVTGKAFVGTSKVGSSITNSLFYLYSNRSGSWALEFNRDIFENCYDLISEDNLVVGWAYRFNNWRPRATRYGYNGNAWNITSNTSYTPAGGANAYMFTMAGTDSKIVHHYNYQGNVPTNRIEMVGGTRPSGADSPKKRTLFMEYNDLDKNSYALYYNSNDDLIINQYNQYLNSWSNLNIGLNFTGVDPKAKITVNQTGSKVYVAYIDNNKISVQYYPISAPVNQVYVDIDATGNNDGSSWADAYTNLQDAIDNTNLPTQIWVAEGTYLPTSGTGNGRTFKLENKVAEIYGGFNGTETALNQRDFRNNITILSGDLNGDDNTNINNAEPTRSDNSYHVVSLKGTGNGTVIDGFTIANGNANGVNSTSCSTSPTNQDVGARGGAIIVQPYNAGRINATIQNCTLENNSGSDTAVYAQFNPCGQTNIVGDIDFKSCIIRNNYSDSESAFLFAGSQQYTQYSRGSLVNSVFYNNTSSSAASCVRLVTSSGGNTTGIDVDVINSTFANNTGVLGNVFKMERAANSRIKNSIIYGNGSISPFSITTSGSSVSNSIVQGGQSGGMSSDPLYTDAANNDFTLQAGSNAIDGGLSSDVPTDITEDLAGNTRISGGAVDMGAYETVVTQYTLTLNATDGTITPNPAGGTYDDGTSITLTATPNSGYEFTGWSGDASGTTNPLDITMDADKTVTATFAPIQRTLTLNATNGSVTATPNSGTGAYDDGSVITLTATPDAGYEFTGWSGDASGTTNPLDITMDADKTVTATFAPIQRTLTLNATNGSVSTNPNPTNGTYDNGTLVTLTATPDAGYEFTGWSGDASGTTNPLDITMDADKTVTATFAPIQRTLTLNATNGSVSTNPNPTNGTYDNGTLVTLTATPNAGYEFTGWSGDASGTTNPLDITMDADKTVTATFAPIQRKLTLNATNGSVSTNPNPTNGTYDNGTLVTLTATPDAGYEFTGWSGDASGTTNPLVITMDADKTVSAVFSRVQYTLTINATNGSVTTNPSPVNGTYDEGTLVTLTATADSGYQFDNWSGDESGTTNEITITMNSNKTITANFSVNTLSINEEEFPVRFKLYPNPVSNYINIETKEEIKDIKLYSMLGKEIKVRESSSEGIEVSNLSKGIYFLMIKTDSGKGISRFIKK
ncbi:InlB B-repeat-containing protein [Tenacibaculum sp. ZS6-P6]|uniref:InlB B-repeat-containing protein n=1 Tax=Tenacibaculum sp. ZS6-P6 TaxID=3447503 RepID=UPI003F996F5C